MSDAATHFTTIRTAIEDLGYDYTEEIFDFDNVPGGKLNKAFRYIPGTASQDDEVGRVNRIKSMDCWFCFKKPARKSADTIEATVIGLQESLEDAITTSLLNLPVWIVSSDWNREGVKGERHIVINIMVEFQHWRNL